MNIFVYEGKESFYEKIVLKEIWGGDEPFCDYIEIDLQNENFN